MKTLYSVDSDRQWLEKLLENAVVRACLKAKRWTPIHAGIGHITDWGQPAIEQPDLVWLNYHQHCWQTIADRKFDMILIDGRFRVACVCQCLLRCGLKDVVMVIHDFWNRPHYHGVLDFLQLEDKADTLGVFRPKKRVNWKGLSLLLQKHQFDFR